MARVKLDLDKLRIVHYPDPRLRVNCAEVTEFDDDLAALSERMLELMRAARGVGLAAPQVGVPIRMFVMSPTGEPADEQVVINPRISDKHRPAEDEEGCLSLPEIHVQIRRPAECTLTAHDLSGATVRREGDGMAARIWQHESDHLDGRLILDLMGPSDKIATRATLRALEEQYNSGGPSRVAQ